MVTRYTQVPRATLWLLPEGTVQIGGGDRDATPVFEVDVDPFYISREPITNEAFEAYKADFVRSEYSLGDEDPAVGMTYNDAAGYCRWYSDLRGQTFRLPTEIEWEYACRANKKTPYFFGDNPDQGDPFLWDRRNSNGKIQAVEGLKANPFGLYGMLGTVWEWTNSEYEPYPLEKDGVSAEGNGSMVLRGGSFLQDRTEFSAFVRRSEERDVCVEDAGFRIVRKL